MKILNLYCGIGGNRKLWTPKGDNHEITAVELDSKIAEIYKDYFPNDTVIIGDAHQYLLDHFKEFDFIWSSPPCPSHSNRRLPGVHAGQVQPIYPAMELWQEIILLQHFHKKGSFYCVENVKSYYEPMFNPQIRERHWFWANFYIHDFPKTVSKHEMNPTESLKMMGYDLSKYTGIEKRKVARNCVLPEVGLHILESAIKNIQGGLFQRNQYQEEIDR
jgi:DNA (cytosine-5)-methyltransferase 1